MKTRISTESVTKKSWLSRIGWLLAIWSASVLALGIVAVALKLIMTAAGMHY